MEKRGSGILLHITSLPSLYGIGDLGTGAYRFIDFLVEAKQSYWQILPLNPTSIAYGNSPYSSFSAFAGNPLLISPELLVDDGILLKSDIKSHPRFPNGRVDYKTVTKYKDKILAMAYEKNKGDISRDTGFEQFCSDNSFWLDDYALFILLKRQFDNLDWGKWHEGLRDRKEDVIKEWREKLQSQILMKKFFQYIFFRQWQALKNYCNTKNIQIIGDVPIYVNYDSADVWTKPDIFKLDNEKKPAFIAGVPPDYFSSKGQLWGHPVYDWDALRGRGYSWWLKRIEHNLKFFHMFRLDHFRGFVGYWQVKAGEKTAVNGQWVEAPAKDFFNTVLKHFQHLPVIAEDLGIITPDIKDIIEIFGFPCMKVLIFAFMDNPSTHPYAPHNYTTRHCIVYTGTHDNNTIRGWFKKELKTKGRKKLFAYLGRKATEQTVHLEIIRLAMSSVADTVIIPMQDILGLGEKARMNLPASSKGNWQWRVKQGQLSISLAKKLSEMTRIYGRAL